MWVLRAEPGLLENPVLFAAEPLFQMLLLISEGFLSMWWSSLASFFLCMTLF